MKELFMEGGWGMWPTLAFGLLMLFAAGRYALKPSRRMVPLLAALGVLTLSAGALGFVTGLMTTCKYAITVEQRPMILAVGFGESLVNVAFALTFVTFAAIGVCLGATKIALKRETA